MVKQVLRVNFALCMLCGVLAIVTRLANALGFYNTLFIGRPNPIGYHSFMDGVLLFFMLTVATASYLFADKRS